jgi:photosystem II stability/assembly factor-like uncharacterized protein
MRIAIVLLCTISLLGAASRWETRHYELTDNGFLDAAAPDSLAGFLCGMRDNVGGIIYKTTNGGETWQELNPWTFEDALLCFGMHFLDQDTGYVTAMGLLYSILPVAVLYKTSDGGNSWTDVYGFTLSFFAILWEDVFFTDQNNGWLTGPNSEIRHTTNGGMDWTIQTAPDTGLAFNSVYFSNPNEGWIVGGSYDTLTGQAIDGVIVHTTDGGDNWTTQVSDAPLQLWDVHFIDNLNGWACGYKDTLSPGVFLHTTDGGTNWTETMAPSVSMGSYGLYAIDFPEPTIGFAVGGGNRSGWSGSYFGAFLKTTDGGIIWEVDTVIFDNDPWGVSPLGMDMYSARWGYAGGARLSAFRYGEIGTYAPEEEPLEELSSREPSIIPQRKGFKILFSKGTYYSMISVYDVLGRKILEKVPSSPEMNIDVPCSGNYFIIFRDKKNGCFTKKVSVVKGS